MIRDVTFTSDGGYLVSATYDKVEQLTEATQMSVSYSASGLKNFVLAR